MATKKKKVAEVPAVNPDEVKELLLREILPDDNVEVEYEGSKCTYSKDGLLLIDVKKVDENGVVHVKPDTKAIKRISLFSSMIKSIKTIVLPESIIAFQEEVFSDFNGTFECETPYFKFINGILYTADMKVLLYANDVQEIVIPNGVTKIEDGAFYGCESLQSIIIPDSVTSIGDDAFAGCESLQSIIIPESVTSIGYYAFGDCTSLKSIVIPNSVTSIGELAFTECDIQSIEIPDNTELQGNPFSKCLKEVKSNRYKLEDGVLYDTHTNKLVGYYKDDESQFDIPNSVTNIGNFAFVDCESLERIAIPDSVTSIGNQAFSGCSSIDSIVIPESVTSIGDNAFSGCSNLWAIAFPDSVDSVGSYIFEDCDGLENIIIPDGTEDKFREMLADAGLDNMNMSSRSWPAWTTRVYNDHIEH